MSTKVEDAVRKLLSGKGWFQIHKAFIKELGFEKSVVFHFLINQLKFVSDGETDERWFYCTVQMMEDQLGISMKTQRRIVKSLIDDGLLFMKKMGLPAKRHFALNMDRIYDILNGWNEPTESPDRDAENHFSVRPSARLTDQDHSETLSEAHSETHLYKQDKRTRQKKQEHSSNRPNSHSSGPSGFFTSEFDRKQGALLRSILIKYDSDLVSPTRTRNGKTRRGVTLKSLAQNISRLRNERGVKESDIKSVLSWLEVRYGDKFVPKLRKVDDIYSRWEKFFNAYRYHQEDQQESIEEGDLKDQVLDWLEMNTDFNPWDGGVPDDNDVRRACEELGIDRKLVKL